MKQSEIIASIFPLRTVLLAEIEYLKSQLAQERRRVDVLQEGLIQAKRPSGLMTQRAQVNPTTKPKPVGWEATRAEIRNERADEIPARPDTRGEGDDADKRLEA
jgi:hypothetical protein